MGAGNAARAHDPKKKQNNDAEINRKMDMILENQVRIMSMFSELGKILMTCADGIATEHPVRTISQSPTAQADPESRAEIEDEAMKLSERRNVTCTQVKAAEILGVSERTIARLLDNGKLRRVAHRVDMTSIAEYMRNPNGSKQPEGLQFEESAKNEPKRRGRKRL